MSEAYKRLTDPQAADEEEDEDYDVSEEEVGSCYPQRDRRY